VRVYYRETASDDLVRQFRYFLVNLNLPEVAIPFRNAVRVTVQSIRQHPLLGPHYPLRNPQLQTLRFCPAAGFEAIGIYYLVDSDAIPVIRILHGKRDIRRLLNMKESSAVARPTLLL
jgi:plasmid stabilization system protein ParE